jgi:hypothetical protein
MKTLQDDTLSWNTSFELLSDGYHVFRGIGEMALSFQE